MTRSPHDFPAAMDYLTLVLEEKPAGKLVTQLRKAPTVHKKAKDLLRASRLPVLPRDNFHVAADLKKIKHQFVTLQEAGKNFAG